MPEFLSNQIIDCFRSSSIAVSMARTLVTKVKLIIVSIDILVSRVSIDILVSRGNTKMQVVDKNIEKN